jgi:hypothetical protein
MFPCWLASSYATKPCFPTASRDGERPAHCGSLTPKQLIKAECQELQFNYLQVVWGRPGAQQCTSALRCRLLFVSVRGGLKPFSKAQNTFPTAEYHKTGQAKMFQAIKLCPGQFQGGFEEAPPGEKNC